jgi:hypothetical protein
MPVANHSTHHCNHHLDAMKKAEAEVAEVEAEEAAEVDYRPRQDQAYFHHTDELPTLTSS